MKYGILTFHRARNYGSALQAYALNKYLNTNENQAETINFHTQAQDDMYRIFKKTRSLKDILYNLLSLCKYKELKLKIRRFEGFVSNEICLSSEEFTDESEFEDFDKNYDFFVCGSDQIWNAMCNDFSTAYLLDFVKDKSKCISYAASIGTSNIPNEFEEVFIEHLKDFKAISVRESRAAEVLKNLLNRDITVLPDPVVILDKQQWIDISSEIPIKGKYILCYFIGDVPGMRDFAKKMSKQSKLPIVVINKNIRDLFYCNKKYYAAGPKEFITLINNAEYVCTDSFHAVMFSIIFHKNFWVFANKRTNNSSTRIENILEIMGMPERMLYGESTDIDFKTKIDYSEKDEIIEELRFSAKTYLNENLKM